MVQAAGIFMGMAELDWKSLLKMLKDGFVQKLAGYDKDNVSRATLKKV